MAAKRAGSPDTRADTAGAEAKSADSAAARRALAAFEALPHGVCLADADGLVTAWNPAAAALTGIAGDRALGQPLRDLLPDLFPADAPFPPVLVRRVGGEERWLAAGVAPLPGAGEEPAGTLVHLRDATAERAAERWRERLLARYAHDLRTPLTSIQGFARTLLREEGAFGADKRRAFLDIIAAEGDAANRMVDDLLTASRLQAGALALRIAPCALGEVFDAALAAVVPSYGSRFAFTLPDTTAPVLVRADSVALRQVLERLLENGAKFSTDGAPVAVAVRREGAAVRIDVRDEGRGIAPADLARLRARCAAAPADPPAPSAGLGLYIVAGVLRHLGGDIAIASEQGRGTTVSVILPAAP